MNSKRSYSAFKSKWKNVWNTTWGQGCDNQGGPYSISIIEIHVNPSQLFWTFMRTYSEPFVGLSWVFFFSSVFCPISCTHQILCWYLYFQEPKYKQILRKKRIIYWSKIYNTRPSKWKKDWFCFSLHFTIFECYNL